MSLKEYWYNDDAKLVLIPDGAQPVLANLLATPKPGVALHKPMMFESEYFESEAAIFACINKWEASSVSDYTYTVEPIVLKLLSPPPGTHDHVGRMSWRVVKVRT